MLTLDQVLEVIEKRRIKILQDSSDPTWTEHFAELQTEMTKLCQSSDGKVLVSRFAFERYWEEENVGTVSRIYGLTYDETRALIEYHWQKLLKSANAVNFLQQE